MIEIVFPSFLSGRRGIALLLLRLFVGVAFLFHGYGKIVDIAGFAAEFGMPHLIAIAAAYVQFGAGLLLVLGLLTPVAGLALARTMAVATSQLMGRGEPFVSPHGHSWEASSFYLVSNIALILLGPGLYSFDWLLFGRKCSSLLVQSQL
jgi:putative oxidoreductase